MRSLRDLNGFLALPKTDIMENILLAGATGHLGRAIAIELRQRGLAFTALVRNPERSRTLRAATHSFRYAEAMQPASFNGVCAGHNIVISALGKSVSPSDRSRPTFEDVDLRANSALIDDALRQGVRKFVYVSALGAERHTDLAYFRVHRAVEEQLIASGMDYSIVRPPALFSAFTEMIGMARKGRMAHLGAADKRTNPIWEGDVARVCVDAIALPHSVHNIGGPEVMSRRQINELVQQLSAPERKVRQVPAALLKVMLPLLRIADRNLYDKLAFFTRVMTEDALGEPVGRKRLEEYLKEHL